MATLPVRVHVREPVNISALDKKKMDPLDYYVEKINTKSLKNVYIVRSGFCFRWGLPVMDSFYKDPYLLPKHLGIAYASIFRREVETLESYKSYCIGHSIWCGGYFHWMTEAVPRLLKLRDRANALTCIIPPYPKLYRVYQETIAPIGFSAVTEYPPNTNLKAPRMVLSPSPARKAEYDPELMPEVRDLYLRSYGAKLDTSERPRCVFVTRRKSRGRNIANEENVEALLASRGFSTIAFEDFTFSEQVSLMSEAKVVLSVHGAGLSNMMFMPPGGAVIELMLDPTYTLSRARVRRSSLANPGYCRLASVLDLHYFIEYCSLARENVSTGLPDILVDIDRLDLVVDQAFSIISH